MSAPAELTVKPRHYKPLLAGHPWVFAEAVEKVTGEPKPGDEVRVRDERGAVLGRGYYSPGSAIAVRLLTRKDESCDAGLLRRRLADALSLRRETLGFDGSEQAPRTAYRLVHAEGDWLGGLVVDLYGDVACVQIHTAGMDRRREALLAALQELAGAVTILDRSDARMRELEGLNPPREEPMRGHAPEGPVEVRSHGARLAVDFESGQKTGLFLDQLDHQAWLARHARGRAMLDVFSYSGGFAVQAARAGAKSVALLERSAAALDAARENLERNAIADAELIEAEWQEGFAHLKSENRRFDLVVLDPPKFARTKADVPQALEGYRRLNAAAAELLNPGALLYTCSCSGNVSELEFERAVAGGLAGSGRRAQVLERRGHAPDHPVPPGFEQGRYLQGLLVRVL